MTKNIIKTTSIILSILAMLTVSQANARPGQRISGNLANPAATPDAASDITRTQAAIAEIPTAIAIVSTAASTVVNEVEKKATEANATK